MKVNAACAYEWSCCHCVVIILLFLSLQKMICVSKWTFWSVRRERYTIDKSGLKLRERQYSQSWVHKLHWCGIIWSFAFGASLPSPCAVLFIPYHLSCPEMISKYTVYASLYCIILYISFVLIQLLCVCYYHLSCGFLSYTVCFYSLCSLAVFWTPNCLACSLEGKWWLTFVIY